MLLSWLSYESRRMKNEETSAGCYFILHSSFFIPKMVRVGIAPTTSGFSDQRSDSTELPDQMCDVAER